MLSRLRLAAPLLFVLASVFGTVPAHAHTDLLSHSPAAGARLVEPPNEIGLTFSEAVDPRLATFTLSVGDGPPEKLTVQQANSDPSTVVGLVDGDAAGPITSERGTWRVGYRVTSGDGHPIQGSWTFTVAGQAPSQSQATKAPAAEPPPGGPSEPTEAETAPASDNTNSLWPIAGPALGIGVLALLGCVLAARRTTRRPGQDTGA